MQTAHKAPDTTTRKLATPELASSLLGRWRDPWFGEISICARDGKVRFAAEKSQLLAGSVMLVGKRFLVAWDDDRVDAEAWIIPEPAQAGRASVLKMAKVDPAADFSFDYEDLAFARERTCD